MFLNRSIRPTERSPQRRRTHARLTRCSSPVCLMWLEERVLLSIGPPDPSASAPLILPASVMNSASSAAPIPLGAATPLNIAQGAAQVYAVDPGSDGRLIVEALPSSTSLALRLSLYDGQGNLLVQSDGQSTGRLDPSIDQHVAAGTDFIEVQSLAGSGSFTLSTVLTPSSEPGGTVPVPTGFQGKYAPIAVGDFTNNGVLDIVTPDGVHLGTGDGTFGSPVGGTTLVDSSSPANPSAIAVGNFNSDGNLDVAFALAGTDSIAIFMGNGDGTFQAPTTIGLPTGSAPDAIVTGDFLGNGLTDLAVADAGTNSITIILNTGNGGFEVLPSISVGQAPISIAKGDFENDGRIDLAVADINSGDVTVLSNQGGGNFVALPPIALPVGAAGFALASSIVAGNFGTGNVDLAVTDSANSVVDILQGHGDGTFSVTSSLAVGSNPFSMVAGDFGNGTLDLAVANANTNNVSVLVGNGNGTFQPAVGFAAGTSPTVIVAGDFNGDGRLDLATGNFYSNDVSVLLGKGDGTFEESTANQAGNTAIATATGDFTGNGNLGLAVLDQGSDSITILPGNGDGTFQQSLNVPLPAGADGPTSIVAADFNDDGRMDLAVADPKTNQVFILLGNGDGTFDALAPVSVPGGPYAITAGDFTGNGRIDLAVADQSSSTVTILLGNGNGTFQTLAPVALAPSTLPISIVTGYFTGNGHLDLAVGGQLFDTVTVLLGNGDGTFEAQAPISLGGFDPSSLTLVTGNFVKNGPTDIAAASYSLYGGNSISILLGNGDGTFQAPNVMSIGVSPVAIVAGKFTNNGIVDLATADVFAPGTDDYSVYLGNGDGTFQGPTSYGLVSTGGPTDLVTGDFTGSGRTDLAITLSSPDDVQVQLNNGDGTFVDPSVVDLVRRETPVVADVNGDNTPDVTVVDAAGDILFRAGRPGEPGNFAPPSSSTPAIRRGISPS